MKRLKGSGVNGLYENKTIINFLISRGFFMRRVESVSKHLLGSHPLLIDASASASNLVRSERHGNVAILTISNPPVNAFSADVALVNEKDNGRNDI